MIRLLDGPACEFPGCQQVMLAGQFVHYHPDREKNGPSDRCMLATGCKRPRHIGNAFCRDHIAPEQDRAARLVRGMVADLTSATISARHLEELASPTVPDAGDLVPMFRRALEALALYAERHKIPITIRQP